MCFPAIAPRRAGEQPGSVQPGAAFVCPPPPPWELPHCFRSQGGERGMAPLETILGSHCIC